MKKTTTTVREYYDDGRLIKETVTEVTEDFCSQPYTPSNPWTYPNTPVYPWQSTWGDAISRYCGETGTMGW